MSHQVTGSIRNNTSENLTISHAWFQFGGVDGSFPTTIAAGAGASFSCSGLVSCSGWVAYQYDDGTTLYFAFSNPAVGQNGIDIGTDTSVWDHMTGQYLGLERTFGVPGARTEVRVAHLLSTSGSTNAASWEIDQVDLSVVVPANRTLDDVTAAHAALPTSGSRVYYKAAVEPTNITGLAQSHFKGMAFYAEKLILTHTNLAVGSDPYGKYLLADDPALVLPRGAGTTDATYDTQFPGLRHPCSAQACGSFLAMGIQEDASSTSSSIEVIDIRGVAANYAGQLIGVIPIPDDGINGVGMTKQLGDDGRYVVAGLNGHTLRLYLSRNPAFDFGDYGNNVFDLVATVTDFPDSGAGLGLVTQSDGTIFVVALNADDSGANNTCNLYELSGDLTSVKPVAQKTMTIPGISDSVADLALLAPTLPPPVGLALLALLKTIGEAQLNTSFRWGKGVAIDEGALTVYATDRNAIPWSQIPAVPINKDFSVVAWGPGYGETN